jgi:hypothetical protein
VWASIATRLSSSISWQFDQTVLAIEATTGTLVTTFQAAVALTVVGALGGDPLPRQTQGLIRWGTASVIAGRRVRGRLYVPGVLEVDNDVSGSPVAALTTALTTAGATILPAGATASRAVVWHRPGAAGAGASPEITAVSAGPVWAVLRSRRA